MGEERNLNLKKAYIQFTYTLKKKNSYKWIFKRKQPNKRMGKKMWPRHKGKNEQTKSTQEGSEAAVCVLRCFSPAWLSVAPRTAARQAPLLTGLSRKEHWRRLPCPPPGDLPKSAIKSAPLTSPVLAGVTYHLCCTTWEARDCWLPCKYKLNHF